MSDLAYFAWFIATALMVIVVLTVGTLAAAGLIGRDRPSSPGPEPARRPEEAADDRTRAA